MVEQSTKCNFLVNAAFFGREGVCQALLEAGFPANSAGDVSHFVQITPLMAAAVQNHVGICEQLVAGGAMLDLCGQWGHTALSLAVEHGVVDASIWLVDRGAGLDTDDIRGMSLIAQAAKSGNSLVVDHLLRKGVDINHADADGSTPLHKIAAAGNVAAVRFLIARGANVNAVDGGGRTPLLMTLAHPTDYYTNEAWSSTQDAGDRLSICKALIDAGANINQTDNDEVSLLMAAAERFSEEIEGELIRMGADPALQDRQGRTAKDFRSLNRSFYPRRSPDR